MECTNCGHEVGLRKNVRRPDMMKEDTAGPQECPECGSDIEKQVSNPTLLNK